MIPYWTLAVMNTLLRLMGALYISSPIAQPFQRDLSGPNLPLLLNSCVGQLLSTGSDWPHAPPIVAADLVMDWFELTL